MTQPSADLDLAPRWPDIARAQFSNRPRGGYDEEEVDRYLDHVAAVIEQSERHRLAQQRELDRLQALQRSGGRSQEALAGEAVELLSRAQEIADKCVADAEQYARDLVLTARSQYREVLERAEQSAEGTQRDLRTDLPAVSAPVPELDYVRTYAHVAQVQLRSVLEALAEQVDKLADVPGAARAEAADRVGVDATRAPAVPADQLWHVPVEAGPASFRAVGS